MTPAKKKSAVVRVQDRKARGTRREDVSFPVAPGRAELPEGYASFLGESKQRIQTERLRVIMAANSAMVILYWDIGRLILDRQQREGWGAKVIDRLSADLRAAYPGMGGLSPRNLKYMRAFAAAWPDPAIVQGPLHKSPGTTTSHSSIVSTIRARASGI
jgi:hypothetical protein